MDRIERAVEILRAGGLVAFATETVYGLGADARNPTAVGKIYEVKGRPSGNPLIVHVADETMARRYSLNWSRAAHRLASAFWPGPLTLVLARSDAIVPAVSAGRQTVALRAPDHPLAQELLRAFDGPIAAPSANKSARISPTTAEHVRHDLGDDVDLILDGGPCRIGIESTVLDVSDAMPILLRPGTISLEQLRKVVGEVGQQTAIVDEKDSAASPGQHAIHYAPRAVAYRFTRDQIDLVIAAKVELRGRSILCFSPMPLALLRHQFAYSIAASSDPSGYARDLYLSLRELDTAETRVIFVEMPPDEPQWAAVRDRLLRATRPL